MFEGRRCGGTDDLCDGLVNERGHATRYSKRYAATTQSAIARELLVDVPDARETLTALANDRECL